MRSITFVSATFLVACGGGDDGPSGKTPDAATQADAPAACAAMPDYGTPTPMNAAALRLCGMGTNLVKCPSTATMGIRGTTTNPELIVYFARLNAQNDFLNVELWKTSMTMPIGPAANVNLTMQNQWMTCGLCVYVDAQVDLQTEMHKGRYLATGGTANIDTVTLTDAAMSTKLAGSIANVTMSRVDIAMDGTSTATADGCSTKVSAHSFDRAMVDPMMQFTGDKLDALYDMFTKRLSPKYAARR